MTKKTKPAETTTSAEAPAKAAKAKPTKAPAKKTKPAKVKRLSAQDAAAKVLTESGTAMNSTEMIEAMSKKGYWSSPNGQTPEATLYAAIIREIGKKGKESRFAKSERGKFERTKAG